MTLQLWRSKKRKTIYYMSLSILFVSAAVNGAHSAPDSLTRHNFIGLVQYTSTETVFCSIAFIISNLKYAIWMTWRNIYEKFTGRRHDVPHSTSRDACKPAATVSRTRTCFPRSGINPRDKKKKQRSSLIRQSTRLFLMWHWVRIFKRLWSKGIDSKEWIPPAYVAWRAGTITLFLLCS